MTCFAIDMVGARHGGGVVVGLGIIAAALEHPDVERLVVFVSPSNERRFTLPTSPKLEVIEHRSASSTTAGRLAWNLGLSRRAARRHGAAVLLCISNAGVGSRAMPTVLYIQQSLPFSSEGMARMRPLERLRFRTLREVMRRSARSAVIVGVQTEVMRDTVRRSFGLDANHVRVFAPQLPTFPAADSTLASELREPDVPTALYVGSTVGYKNVDRLLTAFRLLRRSMRARLLMVTPESFNVSLEGTRCLGSLDRAGLRAAYEASDLVVMPSLIETVGLPLLEAMALDVPVAAADRPYAREICGDAAFYFDPLDPSAIADVMKRGLTDATLRERLRVAGRSRIDGRVANDYAALVNASMMVARAARAD